MLCKIHSKRELRAFLNKVLNNKWMTDNGYDWEFEALLDILSDVMSVEAKEVLDGCFHEVYTGEFKSKGFTEQQAKKIRSKSLDAVKKIDAGLFPVYVMHEYSYWNDQPSHLRVLSPVMALSSEDLLRDIKLNMGELEE